MCEQDALCIVEQDIFDQIYGLVRLAAYTPVARHVVEKDVIGLHLPMYGPHGWRGLGAGHWWWWAQGVVGGACGATEKASGCALLQLVSAHRLHRRNAGRWLRRLAGERLHMACLILELPLVFTSGRHGCTLARAAYH